MKKLSKFQLLACVLALASASLRHFIEQLLGSIQWVERRLSGGNGLHSALYGSSSKLLCMFLQLIYAIKNHMYTSYQQIAMMVFIYL